MIIASLLDLEDRCSRLVLQSSVLNLSWQEDSESGAETGSGFDFQGALYELCEFAHDRKAQSHAFELACPALALLRKRLM